MKTRKQYQIFIEELKLLTEKHGIGLSACCLSESIDGEIELVDLENYKYPIIKFELETYYHDNTFYLVNNENI